MAKKVSSVRFGKDTEQKLEQLVMLEKNKAEKFNAEPKSKNQIIEDAIAEYFAIHLDKNSGTDYLTRMNMQIQDAMKQQNTNIEYSLNLSLRYAMMAYETSITVLKYLRMTSDKNINDTFSVQELVYESRSIFEEAIKDKVDVEIGGNF